MGEFDFKVQKQILESADRTYARPVGSVFPTFFVGIGGAGGQVVNHIYGMLKGRPDFEDRYKKLIQFIVFDTDQDDLKELDIRYKFLISDFPKGEFVRIKQGREHEPADPFFGQWWPDWYATRPDSVKGAGQIRVESRLSLYYQLEDDRQKIIALINEASTVAKDHDNPFRLVRPPQAYVHMFCSCAGGTGSGGLLTLAYLFRSVLEAQRLSPVMVAHVLLPPLFYRKVRSRLHDDIKANGYAFLKELEWFMTLGYNNNPRMVRGDVPGPQDDFIEFNYNPNARPSEGNQRVVLPPFHLVNLIDEPGDISFEDPGHIYPAIAGAAYVELFSPILGGRESEEDNYYKKIKHLESGFSLNYGTFGLSMLVLPDRDILDYCVDRMMLGLLEQLGGEQTGAGDQAFLDGVISEATSEVKACAKEPTKVEHQRFVRLLAQAGLLDATMRPEEKEILAKGWQNSVGAGARDGMFQAILKVVEGRFKAVEEEADRSFQMDCPLDPSKVPGDSDGKAGGGRRVANAVFEDLRAAVRAGVAAIEKATAAAPDRWAQLARDMEQAGKTDQGEAPSPMVKRLALVHARNWAAAQLEDLRAAPVELKEEENPFSAHRLDQLWEKRAVETFRLKEDDWKSAPKLLKDGWSETMAQKKAQAIVLGRAQVLEGLKGWMDEQLTSFKQMNPVYRRIVDDLRKKLSGDEPEPAAGGMTDEFVLDDEVLRGIRTRRRHWDRLFDWLVKWKVPQLRNKADIDIGHDEQNDEIRPRLSTALVLQARIQAHLKDVEESHRKETANRTGDKPSDETIRLETENAARDFCRLNLVGLILGRRQAGDDREDKGLLIDECLELEARFEIEEMFVRDHLANYAEQVHGRNLLTAAEIRKRRAELVRNWEPKQEDIEAYVDEKIKFVSEKARELSRLRLTETTKVDPFVFVCVHPLHYVKDKPMFGGRMSLWEVIRRAPTRFREARELGGWVDEKRVAFFSAQAGLPVHNFWPVNGEFKDAYEHIYREYVTGLKKGPKPKCDFPSHIDRNFEDPNCWDPHDRLPSLDPGRRICRPQGGLESFLELAVLDVVRQAPADGGKSVPAGFKTSWEKAKVAGHLGDDPDKLKEVWIIDGQPPRLPPGHDPVLVRVRRPFQWVLGDRLDRAFLGYENLFLRQAANAERVAHVEELLAQKRREEERREDPSQLRDRAREMLEQLQDQLAQERERLEGGYRNKPYIDFLVSAVDCLRALYLRYKGGEAE